MPDDDDTKIKGWLDRQPAKKLPAGRAYGSDSLYEWSQGRRSGYYGPSGNGSTTGGGKSYSKTKKGKLADD